METAIHWKTPFDEGEVDKLREMAKPIKWDGVLESTWEATKELLRSENAHKAKLRAESLDVPGLSTYQEDVEKTHHERSLRLIRVAKERLDAAVASQSREDRAHLDESARNKDHVKVMRSEGRDMYKRALMDTTLDAAEAGELLAIFDEGVDTVEKKGYSGLVDDLGRKLTELEKKRTEPGRGRESHSPLEWWKWVLIAVTVGAALGTLIACLYWQGCAWLMTIIKASCSIVAAIATTGC